MTPRIAMPSATLDVSVVIVNYNTGHLLPEMWQCLQRSLGHLHVEAIIVDNASRDDSVDVIRRICTGAKLILNNENVGFGRANNQALPHVHGRYVLLLNTDAFIAPDTLVKTVGHMDSHPDVGVLGVKLVGRDGQMQPCCRYFPTPWNTFVARSGLKRYLPKVQMVDELDWNHDEVRLCDWVTGCYFLVRRETIDNVGLFDPRYFLYCEEMDLCRMVKKAGWQVAFYPHTQVIHIGGESAKTEGVALTSGNQISELQIESELLYFRKQHGLAGLLQFIALAFVADVVNSFRTFIKCQGVKNTKQVGTRASLLFRTRFGLKSTK